MLTPEEELRQVQDWEELDTLRAEVNSLREKLTHAKIEFQVCRNEMCRHCRRDWMYQYQSVMMCDFCFYRKGGEWENVGN